MQKRSYLEANTEWEGQCDEDEGPRDGSQKPSAEPDPVVRLISCKKRKERTWISNFQENIFYYRWKAEMIQCAGDLELTFVYVVRWLYLCHFWTLMKCVIVFLRQLGQHRKLAWIKNQLNSANIHEVKISFVRWNFKVFKTGLFLFESTF